MKLTEYQKRILGECLRKASKASNAPAKCPFCGGTELDLKSSALVLVSLGESANRTMELDTDFSTAAVVCKNCRYVNLFAI